MFKEKEMLQNVVDMDSVDEIKMEEPEEREETDFVTDPDNGCTVV